MASAKAAARPPARAMAKSIGVGWVRAITACGKSFACKSRNGINVLNQVNRNEIRMESSAPRNNAESASRSKRSSPRIEAIPKPMMGDIKGATNIAPIITAGELTSSPRVAITLESNTNKKKSKSGCDESRSWALNFFATVFANRRDHSPPKITPGNAPGSFFVGLFIHVSYFTCLCRKGKQVELADRYWGGKIQKKVDTPAQYL